MTSSWACLTPFIRGNIPMSKSRWKSLEPGEERTLAAIPYEAFSSRDLIRDSSESRCPGTGLILLLPYRDR